MELLKEDKLCACCGKQFRGDISFCPDDDDELISLTDNPFEGTQFAHELEVQDVLGWGGWGIVYRARDRNLDRTVAIKMLHKHLAANQQRQRRFKREATVLADLSHPNIASVLKYDALPDNRPFVVMEFLSGKTLEDALKESKRMPIAQAIDLFIDTCEALSFAHGKGVVHRDIKPSNLMLTKDHRGRTTVKVLDFGLAKIFALDDALNLTRTGETIGTPYYMSPEQCRGMALDPRSDIYSLGCVMYEAITGVKPVIGDSYYDCMQRHVNGQVTPPAMAARNVDVGSDLEQIILKAMARNPEERYQSANRLKADLEFFRSTLTESKGTFGTKIRSYEPPAPAPPAGYGGMAIISGVLAVVCLVGVSAALWQTSASRKFVQVNPTSGNKFGATGTPALSSSPSAPTSGEIGNRSSMQIVKGDPNRALDSTKPETVVPQPPAAGPATDKVESDKPSDPKAENKVEPKDGQIEIKPVIQPQVPAIAVNVVVPPAPAVIPTPPVTTMPPAPVKPATVFDDREKNRLLDNLAKGIKPSQTVEGDLAAYLAWTRKYGFNAVVQNEMRHIYMTNGDRTRMKECVEQVFLNQSMDEYEFQIVSGWKMDNPVVAIASLKEAVNEYSGYPNTVCACYMKIGDIYIKQGNKNEALYNYQKVLDVRPENAYHALARSRLQVLRGW